MFESIFHNYLAKENPEVGIVELGDSLLGGSEALMFTSLLEEMCKNGLKNIIIDLHKVETINSSGLGMLVGALSTVKKFEVGLYFVMLSKKIEKLIEMTHLNSIFQVFGTIKEALNIMKMKNKE
jgi:anti-sigma B factor antagonist